MTITTAWLTALLLSWTGGDICTSVVVIDQPTAQEPFVQLLSPSSAHIHHQTVSTVLVGDRAYTVTTQETFYVMQRSAPRPVAFQVYIDGEFVRGGAPRLDVEERPRPAWCALPTGTPLHP